MTAFFYRAEVEMVAATLRIDPDLMEAVIWQESAGDAHARRAEPAFWERYMAGKPEWDGYHWLRVSSSLGLMQIMPTTACETGLVKRTDPDFPECLFRPIVNLEVGGTILRSLMQWAGGDLEKALAAFNGGKGNANAPRPRGYALSVIKKLEEVRRRRA